ncbi:MAG: hypothetical protein K5919_09940 [Clostridiales bacterium]|nr:hypothetical protein [Clostridiales bacterium]
MKKLIPWALLLILALPCAWAEEIRYEGAGYATPEEAVQAYGEAFARGDVTGMIATFAVETYVDRMDPAAYLQYVRRYRWYDGRPMLPLPLREGYPRQLRVLDCVSALTESFGRQYAVMSGVSKMEDDPKYGGGMYFTPNDGERIQEFLETAAGCVWPGEVTVGPVLGRDVSSRIDWGKRFDENMDQILSYLGGDEMAVAAVTLRIGGTDYLQIMQCVRYGEKWYNQALGGYAASYLTAVVDAFRDYLNTCGLIPADEALALLP